VTKARQASLYRRRQPAGTAKDRRPRRSCRPPTARSTFGSARAATGTGGAVLRKMALASSTVRRCGSRNVADGGNHSALLPRSPRVRRWRHPAVGEKATRSSLGLHSLPEMPAGDSAIVRLGNAQAPGPRRHARTRVLLLHIASSRRRRNSKPLLGELAHPAAPAPCGFERTPREVAERLLPGKGRDVRRWPMVDGRGWQSDPELSHVAFGTGQ